MTLRQLLWMADGRGEIEWGQTASILAMIANANRDPKKRVRPFSTSEFNPYGQRHSRQTRVTDMSELKGAFEGFKGRRTGRK